jgi:hypothetical protein
MDLKTFQKYIETINQDMALAHGSMLRVRAMQQLLGRYIKNWGTTALGLMILSITSILAFNVVYMPNGFGKQSNLHTAGIGQLPLPTVASTANGADFKKALVTTIPRRMLLPTVDLALDIDNATINIKTNEWPLSDIIAQYANFTPGLGSKKGTMLIYGHNTWSVMRKTSELMIGDELTLVDENNNTWKFTLTKEENVVPENVKFIYEDVPFRVVMFTCGGWNDQYRRLMYFTPVD